MASEFASSDAAELQYELLRKLGPASGAGINALLYEAAGRGHESTVQFLLERGADLNFRMPNINLPAAGHAGRTFSDTVLAQAVLSGKVKVLQQLLAAGARYEPPAVELLSMACEAGHAETVQFLWQQPSVQDFLALPSESFVVNGDKVHAFVDGLCIAAARAGNAQVIDMLFEIGGHFLRASTRLSTNAPRVLDSLAERGHVTAAVAYLNQLGEHEISRLKASPRPGDPGPGRLLDHALEVAAAANQQAFCDLLLSRGADVNGATYNSSPLGSACRSGHVAMVDYLLRAGANPNRNLGFALSAALRYPAIVERLLEAGGDPTTMSADQWRYALRNDCTSLTLLLESVRKLRGKATFSFPHNAGWGHLLQTAAWNPSSDALAEMVQQRLKDDQPKQAVLLGTFRIVLATLSNHQGVMRSHLSMLVQLGLDTASPECQRVVSSHGKSAHIEAMLTEFVAARDQHPQHTPAAPLNSEVATGPDTT